MAAPITKTEYDFMYPDLLSKEGLLFVLRQRYISHLDKDLDSLDKDALVELYNRFILPSPQRTYRLNRRGQQMTRAQKVLDRKRKILSPDTDGGPSSAKKQQTAGPSSGLVNNSLPDGSAKNRLKPPPSCINVEKKVVKLKSSNDGASDKGSKGDADLSKAETTAGTSSEKEVTIATTENGKTSTSSSLSNDESPVKKKKKFAPIKWP